MVLGVCRRVLRDAHDAEDAAKARKLLAKSLSARGLGLPAGAPDAALAAQACSAQLSDALVCSTSRVAALVAAGQMAAVPTAAAVLMKGAMKVMFLKKLKLAV